MVTQAVARNPERTAWTVLLASFFTFVALLATVVFGGRYILLNAARSQAINNVPSGIVQVTQPGRTTPEVNLQDIPVGSTIATDPNSEARLTFNSPGGEPQVLVEVHVYGESLVQVVEADSPRFSTGVDPHRVVLNLTRGRIRVLFGVDVARPVHVEVASSPSAVIVLEAPGSKADIEATFTGSMVTVREGEAVVSAANDSVTLTKDQRAEVKTDSGLAGPFSAARNVIVNGDFGAELNGEWQRENWSPADPADDPGTADITVLGGRHTLRLRREQSRNWGQVGVVQNPNLDLRGYSSLRLHLDVFLHVQSVPNCGLRGTECPLMVKMYFEDTYGTTHEWVHGFFFDYRPDPNMGATKCLTCSPIQWEHEQWPKGKWQVYDSPNLIDVFKAYNIQIVRLNSIAIQAGGHTFTSYVTDVQLLAQ